MDVAVLITQPFPSGSSKLKLTASEVGSLASWSEPLRLPLLPLAGHTSHLTLFMGQDRCAMIRQGPRDLSGNHFTSVVVDQSSLDVVVFRPNHHEASKKS